MHGQTPVEQFLYGFYGYARLESLLRHQKPKEVNLREFFAGTIMGTYRTRFDAGDEHEYSPSPAKIRETSEIGAYMMHLFDSNLPYHIDNQTFFNRMTREEIVGFLDRALPLFSSCSRECNLPERKREGWTYGLKADGLRIYAFGSASIQNSKRLIVDFNTPETIKDDINHTVRWYYGWKNQAKA